MINKVDIPEGRYGDWRVQRFEISEEDEKFQRLLASFNPHRSPRIATAGTYTKLVHKGAVVMSDTPVEMDDHIEAVRNASGHCLVGGLGLGMVVSAMLEKDDVEKVTVVEIFQEVIKLTGETLKAKYGDRLEVIQDDVLEWESPKGSSYGVVWMDIWNDICSDNSEDMGILAEQYVPISRWFGNWSEDQMEEW